MKNTSTESTFFKEILLEPHSLAFVVGEKEEKIGVLGIAKGDQQEYSRSEEVSCDILSTDQYGIEKDQSGISIICRDSKESQPETPANVNGHGETLVSYPANRVVDVDKSQC